MFLPPQVPVHDVTSLWVAVAHLFDSATLTTRGRFREQDVVSSLNKTLAVISGNQQEVLRRTETIPEIAGKVDRVLQEQLDLRRRVSAMSTVLEHLAMDELRMPHTFLVLPDEHSKFPRPKQWFADRGRLRFICAQCLELVPCGEDGTGFLVSQPKVR